MSNNPDITKMLNKGDIKNISQIVGCSWDYVYRILKGKRDVNSPKAQKVMAAALSIANHNLKVSKDIQELDK